MHSSSKLSQWFSTFITSLSRALEFPKLNYMLNKVLILCGVGMTSLLCFKINSQWAVKLEMRPLTWVMGWVQQNIPYFSMRLPVRTNSYSLSYWWWQEKLVLFSYCWVTYISDIVRRPRKKSIPWIHWVYLGKLNPSWGWNVLTSILRRTLVGLFV